MKREEKNGARIFCINSLCVSLNESPECAEHKICSDARISWNGNVFKRFSATFGFFLVAMPLKNEISM